MHKIKSCTLQDHEKVEQVLLETGLAKNTEDAKQTFADEMQKGDQYFLATDQNDNPLGIVSGKTEGRPRHGLYELYHIGVLEKARGTGVAKELFGTLINHAKELFKNQGHYLRKFYLKTSQQNTGDHKFYNKMGMIQTDSLTDHFAKGRSELIFHILFDKKSNIQK